MRVSRARFLLSAVALLISFSAEASVVTLNRPDALAAKTIVSPASVGDAAAMQESLRRDVAEHPEEFVVFATEAGANQFAGEHRSAVEMETSGKIISRGVVGYWQGKMIVVLPWNTVRNLK
ncbi:hypothetical protein [Granulicella sp. S190]|uniref:hypothetical protein n=1 Tax=Granulicella sp. S190 TaxID=1747226 RepID=UPI00131D3D2D|nr:hypothetical protein [Granulicella sp. S190]